MSSGFSFLRLCGAFSSQFGRILADDQGATLVEYALIVGLIAVVALTAISLLGKNASGTLNKAATSI